MCKTTEPPDESKNIYLLGLTNTSDNIRVAWIAYILRERDTKYAKVEWALNIK